MSCIPVPLPPRIELDADTLPLLSQADQSLGRLARIGHFMKNSALLVKPLLRRETVLSSHIEGTQSGLAELYRYEVDRQPFVTVPAAAKLLGVMYRTAQLHVDRLQQEGILKPRDTRRYEKVYVAGSILRVLNADTRGAKRSS
jgi:Fic family protein